MRTPSYGFQTIFPVPAPFPQGGFFLELKKFIRELLGIFLIFCALFLLLALLTFDATDPSVNYVKSDARELHNKAGLFGAYAAGFLDDFFGVGALLWPCAFAALGAVHLANTVSLHWWRWAGIFLLTLCLLSFASATDIGIGDLIGGGMVGNALHGTSVHWLSPFGSFLLWFFVLLAGIQLVANFSWTGLAQHIRASLETRLKQPAQAGKESSAPRVLRRIKNASDAILGRARELATRIKKTAASSVPTVEKAAPESTPLSAPAPEEAPAEQPQSTSVPESPEDEGLPMPHILPHPVLLNDDDDPFAPSQDLRPLEPPDSGPVVVESAPPQAAEEPQQTERAGQPATRRADLRIFHDREPVLPSPDLLKPPPPPTAANPEALQAKGQALMTCFNDFDIHGELARITPGPVVTMFEVKPAAGVRVSKIANLADDLSLALRAVAVRIQAPIPGSDTVGIEIPNDVRETVNFRELVESASFQKGEGPLTMILGKNIAGLPYMADLTRMPHMLVAGATGAGKSVCLNSILVSLLYKLSPRDMRLLLVDPKRIELAVYADLPHLVHPVVTEMDDAKNALDWAVQDMKKRYKTFERLGVRNIVAYHQKLASFGGNLPPGLEDLSHMPYMVIVIDELADLMMTAAREVEMSIVRLAQLARAAGIHMILATQRPSVDVVTGLIKANFPCRISFQVTSKHDSRTILDQVGAEHLLGRGDMLFKPAGGRLLRLHGPFLSDEEVALVAAHWKAQQPPDYQVDFSQWTGDAPTPSIGGDATGDALYGEARSFVLEHGRASISLLQRHLKIGFNRAARLMEQFERDGLIGPADGSKPRTVIK